MHSRPFSRVFRRITVVAVLAACGSEVGACGQEEPVESDGFAPACEGGRISSFDGFTAGTPVDWLATRFESGSMADGGDGGLGPVTVTTSGGRGTPCSGARDVPGCLARVESTRVLEQCSRFSCSSQYFIYTRGDEVGVAETTEEVSALFSPVDTAAEAYYFAQRYQPGTLFPRCDAEPRAKFKVDPNGGVAITFVVHRLGAGACDQGATDEMTVHVSRDGLLVTEVGRKPLDLVIPCGLDAN